MRVEIKFDNIEDWDKSVLKMPVIKEVDGIAEYMLTDTFGDYARNKGVSFVMFQFPKGEPEKAVPDAVNCTEEEYRKLIKVLTKEDK